MNGRTGLLLGIMIAQLLLIGLLLLVNSGSQAPPERLLALDPGAVNVLTLEAGEDAADEDPNEPVVLSRGDGGWLIGDLPADGEKVDGLLEQLAALGPGWPVATTAEARERFAVTEDGFRKRVEFTLDDDSSEVLLLGTSPGFKRLHARRPGSDAIYSVALGDFDLPVTADDWLDKALLALEGPVLAASRRGILRVERETADASEWRLNAAAAGDAQVAATENVQRWLERFENLRVVAAVPAPGAEQPDDVFIFTTAAGELTYTLYHDADADRYTMKRSDIEGFFEVPGYIALQMGASPESLLPTPPEAGEMPEAVPDLGRIEAPDSAAAKEEQESEIITGD